MFELALSEVSGKPIALPFWDWTDPESTRAVFSHDMMGPSGDPNCSPDCKYAVLEGPFRKGSFSTDFNTLMEDHKINYPASWEWTVRAIGSSATGEPAVLPTRSEVEELLALETYDSRPYDQTADRMKSFRNYLEGNKPPGQTVYMHNVVHGYVSGDWTAADGGERVGTMAVLDVAPSDPVFFLHHCNVDRLWALWQAQNDGRFMNTYVPESGAREGWNLNDEMWPYSLWEGRPLVGDTITPASQLDFEALGFTYDDLP